MQYDFFIYCSGIMYNPYIFILQQFKTIYRQILSHITHVTLILFSQKKKTLTLVEG
jgi:hypothetical protein